MTYQELPLPRKGFARNLFIPKKTYHSFSLFNCFRFHINYFIDSFCQKLASKRTFTIYCNSFHSHDRVWDEVKFEWQSFGCLFIFRTRLHMSVLAYSATEQLRLVPRAHYEQMDSLNCRIYQSTCRCVFYYCEIYSRVLCAFYKSIAVHVVRLPHVFSGSFLRVPNDII